MKILAIETSCDETAVAIVEDGRHVIISQVFSQIDVHKVFGGVVPEIAAREHLKILDPMVKDCLAEANLSLDDIDALAVTQGPGLIGALLVGVTYAKGLAVTSGKPLIPVNHVHAHVHGAMVEQEAPAYPCLALVVSGGHTNIYYMESPTSFELLAHTLDDACGECFDKVAKIMDLGYPGGPIVEKIARHGRLGAVEMPKMIEDKNRLTFSYSGLKTYMVNLLRRETSPLSTERQADILAAFQEEALGQLVRKVKSSLTIRPETRMVLVAGGVAANQRFRQLMADQVKVAVRFPNLKYCSDNAAMIAGMAYHMSQEVPGLLSNRSHDWDCYARYSFDD